MWSLSHNMLPKYSVFVAYPLSDVLEDMTAVDVVES